MSDRPMRLKYLTKMKIILCTFLLYITAVSAVGQSVELNGILGESVKFPAAVKNGGSLMHSGVTIGDVTSGRFTAARYSHRLQWDSSTGLFSISELKMEDIGEYKVQNTDQNINTVFQLNVYINVSKPHVSITHNEYPCTIECTAERGTGVTLSWYREGEEKPFISLVESAPHLHLPQSLERSGIYTCEAKNSVSNEKASITVGAHCTAPSGPSTGTIVASVIAVVAVFTAVVFAVLYRHKRAVIYDAVRRAIQGIRSKDSVGEYVDPDKLVGEYVDPDKLGIRSKDSVGEYVDPDKLVGEYVDPDKLALKTSIQESPGLSKGKNELGAEGDHRHLRDDLS